MEGATWLIIIAIILLLWLVYREYRRKCMYLGGTILKQRANAPNHSDSEIVKSFVKTMIPHNQVAIDKALETYKFSHNLNLKWEARRIVLGQDYNVWTLWNFFYPVYRRIWSTDAEFSQMYKRISETHNRVLAMKLDEAERHNPYFPTKVPLTESERRFVEDMINYHQQTISICEEFVKRVSMGDSDIEYVNMILALCYDINRQLVLEIGQLRDFIGA